jgi:GNAT superfamily N-acetyltransferase
MLEITRMTHHDIPFTVRLVDGEGWGHAAADLARLLDFEPSGCFLARWNRRRVGMVTTTSFGAFAFLGMLIVRPGARGRGIGAALLATAIDYLRDKGVRTIELDGVFAAAPLYRRLGFKDKYLSLRVYLPAARGRATRVPLAQEYIEDIIALDRTSTGLDRERVIRRLIDDYNGSFCLIKKGKLLAYAVAKPRASGFVTLGPFLAQNRNAAASLISGIQAKHKGRKIVLGVPEIHREAVDMFSRKGYLHSEPSLRMYLGSRRNYEKDIYGIIAPEKGYGREDTVSFRPAV